MNNKVCPVCGKEKKQISLSEYDCEYCGFTNAFIQFFASEEGYKNWKNNVKLAVEKYKNKKRESLANSNCLTVGNSAVAFLDMNSNTMYIALGNGRVQTEQNAMQFSSSERNFAVLYKNGTVKVFGEDNEFGQKNTEGWKNIIYITTAPNCTYGITKEGNVVYAGALVDPAVSRWKNLKLLLSSDDFIVGVHHDGKVSISSKDTIDSGLKAIEHWSNINGLALTKNCCVGLMANGSIKYSGKTDDPRRQCENWKDIISVVADNAYVYGLTKDGNILVAGNCKSFLDKGRKNASTWKDIVAISCNKSGIGAITGAGELLFAGTIAGDEKKVREQWSGQIKQNINI